MRYNPHTDSDRQAMMATIGIKDVADLFVDIPEAYRFPDLDLPGTDDRDGDRAGDAKPGG